MPGLIQEAPTPVAHSATAHTTNKMAHENQNTGLVRSAVEKIEKQIGDAMEGVEFGAAPAVQPTAGSSIEVSPSESGTTTPQVTIAPCPERLTPTVPPKNFGAVETGLIYRSGFPDPKNIEFLEGMDLRAVLTLVETEPEAEFHIFTSLHDIKHVTVPIVANKEGEVRTTPESLCQALLVALDPRNHPLQIHCNRGKHRTGCIVACLRKIQQWPIEEILAEYDTYASPKARPEDIMLIKSFEPESVYEYAKAQGILKNWPREFDCKEAANIWELASALPPYMIVTPSTISESGSTDDGLMMTRATIDPTLVTYKLESQAAVPDADKITQAETSTGGDNSGFNLADFVDVDMASD